MTPRVGISGCLLGMEIRFDGGHKRDRFVTDEFGRYVSWVPVCPEVAVGMGTPREAVRLVGPRLVGSRSGTDWTDRMAATVAAQVERIVGQDIDGFVVKRGSPTCGLERVRVYSATNKSATNKASGMPTKDGVGMFTRALRERLPVLPVEEEGRLHDPVLRESFLDAVFAHARWRALLAAGATRGALVRFHAQHKLLLLAHEPVGYREAGRIVAHPEWFDSTAEQAEAYGLRFMQAMNQRASVGKHVNVLQHMVGYFRDALDAASRAELRGLIEDYAARLVPLTVPLALLRHHVRNSSVAYLRDQLYLEPTPATLRTRVHV